jgi:hypothetical protein
MVIFCFEVYKVEQIHLLKLTLIVQNDEAFTFTDNLFNEGIHYETAESLQEGEIDSCKVS